MCSKETKKHWEQMGAVMGSTRCSCQEALCALCQNNYIALSAQTKNPLGYLEDLEAQLEHRPTTLYIYGETLAFSFQKNYSKSSVGRSCSNLPKTYDTHKCKL